MLQRSLYGLKQAPRAWFTHLHDFLLSMGFRSFNTDVSLFIHSVAGSQVYLLMYVDDILLMGSDFVLVSSLLDKLSSVFKIRDLCSPKFFLGIETVTVDGGLLLSQHRYMQDILKRVGMVDCKLLATPARLIDSLTEPYANPTQYRSLVGVLQYLTVTRPDLSYVVNKLCQFMHAPTMAH